MRIFFNEKELFLTEDESAFMIKERYKPDGDLVIYNGFPIQKDVQLKDGDKVTVIKRGEVPSRDELESLMIARHTPGVFEAMKKAVVGIAGVGGLGSNIAISLARVGIGKLILVDFDVVEPSNLNRQQYFVEHIGMYKVDALKELISKINPFINIETHKVFLNEQNIEEIFKESSIVVEAFDKAENKAILANTILSKCPEKFFVSGSGMAGYFSSNLIKSRRVSRRFFLCGDEKSEAKIGNGLMAPRVGIVANHMANTVVRILCNELEP